MKAVRIAAIAVVGYVGLVVLFETFLRVAQPEWDETAVITTNGPDGLQDRVLVPMMTDGRLYVSANHWPRSWYNRALADPEVKLTRNGETADYTAVPLPSASPERQRVNAEHAHPAWFRFLTGYPSRDFLRLDPRQDP